MSGYVAPKNFKLCHMLAKRHGWVSKISHTYVGTLTESGHKIYGTDCVKSPTYVYQNVFRQIYVIIWGGGLIWTWVVQGGRRPPCVVAGFLCHASATLRCPMPWRREILHEKRHLPVKDCDQSVSGSNGPDQLLFHGVTFTINQHAFGKNIAMEAMANFTNVFIHCCSMAI